jgi:hypothetical protein
VLKKLGDASVAGDEEVVAGAGSGDVERWRSVE